MPTHDREVLETQIFRALFLDGTCSRVLFVGCDSYTSWYGQIFDEKWGFRFSTVDPDPAKARFGSSVDHVVGRLEELDAGPERLESFDLVMLNGVFNYGIDSDAQKRRGLAACRALLRRGGLLVIGYRNAPGKPDIDRALISPAEFRPHVIPGASASELQTRHTNFHAFVCYERI
jgi:SAM-dependent methyltransferase